MTLACEGILRCLAGLRVAARLRLSMESSGPRQRRLPFGRKEYQSVWNTVPARDRKEGVTLWGRLIAAAARVGPRPKGEKR
jgi:hypothetical protein